MHKANYSIGLLFIAMILSAALGTQAEAPAKPTEFKLKAQLIWGTDDDKPKDKPKIKDLDSKLSEKLRKIKIFKWKNYFEVDRETFKVKAAGSAITSMSRKCVIEVRHLGESNFEVKLYGEGKLQQTVRQALPKDEYLILGGDDKEKYNDAWIVAISLDNGEKAK